MSEGDINLTANDITISSTNFSVDENGNLTCTNADISGKVTANDGEIGGFTIDSTSLHNGMETFSDTTHNGVYVGTDGIALGKGAFKVSNDGLLITNNIAVNGAGQIYLYTQGSASSNITVQHEGATSMDGDYFHAYYGHSYDSYLSYDELRMDYVAGNPLPPFRVWFTPSGQGSGSWSCQAGAFVNTSSIHAKDNIEDMTEEDAKKILSLNPVSFDYKTGLKDQRGLIAEDVADIIPNCVFYPNGTTKDTYEYDDENPMDVPGIDYTKFVPYLIKMVQMQQKEIDELKGA